MRIADAAKEALCSLNRPATPNDIYSEIQKKNPSILHRKELLVDENYSLRGRFERLTRQEERSGLLDSDESIGRAQEWGELLEAKGLEVRGHRLYRLKKTPDSPS